MDTIINTAPGRGREGGGCGGLFILVSFSTSWPPALVNALGCVWVMRSGVKWGFAGGEGIRGGVCLEKGSSQMIRTAKWGGSLSAWPPSPP